MTRAILLSLNLTLAACLSSIVQIPLPAGSLRNIRQHASTVDIIPIVPDIVDETDEEPEGPPPPVPGDLIRERLSDTRLICYD